MPNLKILGAVLPIDLRISCGRVPVIHVKAEGGLTFDLALQIIEGRIIVDCNTNSLKSSDVSFIIVRALDASRVAANLVAFASGVGIAVHLHTLIHETGYESPIASEYPDLRALCTAYKMPASDEHESGKLGALFLQIVSDDTFSMILNDLVEAISFPHDGPFNRARALDGVRRLIAPTLNKTDGWKQVQRALNVSDAYLKFVSKSSEAIRHADLSTRPATDVEECIRRTWKVMDRFLKYRESGCQPLSGPDFPILNS